MNGGGGVHGMGWGTTPSYDTQDGAHLRDSLVEAYSDVLLKVLLWYWSSREYDLEPAFSTVSSKTIMDDCVSYQVSGIRLPNYHSAHMP